MTPALTETLFALGVADRVVGVTTFCTYPPEARLKPKIGGYLNPSVEAILALRPDLALVSPGPGNRETAQAVRRAGVRVEVIPSETLEGAFSAITRVAGICGAEERGRTLARIMRSRIASTHARVRSLPRVKTLFCLQVDPIIAAGRGTFPSELLELAGGGNVVAPERYPRLGIESVMALGPEVILQARMDKTDPSDLRTELRFWAQWPTIPAMRDHRVFLVDPDITLRPGPRLADAVEYLAALLHPAPEDPSAKSRGLPPA